AEDVYATHGSGGCSDSSSLRAERYFSSLLTSPIEQEFNQRISAVFLDGASHVLASCARLPALQIGDKHSIESPAANGWPIRTAGERIFRRQGYAAEENRSG
ncbi:hypothetical protein, partial [Xanthomonas arboricola]|uniref:hypothetical protein n=1 Tax=Xanthomonas arboricola TaxID=56448 RepID=UPI001CA5D12A